MKRKETKRTRKFLSRDCAVNIWNSKKMLHKGEDDSVQRNNCI